MRSSSALSRCPQDEQVAKMAVEPRAGCRFLRLADNRSYRRIGLVHLKNHFQTHWHRTLVQYLKSDIA
jgi:hypothetical protein